MIWFFRDFLDGPLYLVVAFLCLIFIMAILGFMMERKQLEKEEKNKMVVLNNQNVTPVYDIGSYEESIKQNVGNQSESLSSGVGVSNISVQNQQAVQPQSVIPNEVLEKSASEGTNSKIPEVLDLNLVDDSNMNQ